jgi:hypothetical protein
VASRAGSFAIRHERGRNFITVVFLPAGRPNERLKADAYGTALDPGNGCTGKAGLEDKKRNIEGKV